MATKIEVASLLSKLNFEIDTSQLEKFLGLTKLVRQSTAHLTRNLRATNTQISDISGKLKNVNKGLNAVDSKKGTNNLSNSYASLAKNVLISNSNLTKLSNTLNVVEPKLVAQNATMGSLVQKWALYAQKVKDANKEARDTPSTRGVAPPKGGVRASGAVGGGMGGGLLGGALGASAGQIINPTFMGAGAGAYAVKEIVRVGREYQKMENVLLASSANTKVWGEHLEYVNKTSMRLGTNISEFGSAYAKMLQATQGKLTDKQTQEIFTNFSEMMVVLGSNDDDQKGIFRAMSQMFSKGKIQMEEVNQLAERNVPALAMLTRAYKELGWTQAEFERKQQKGQIDPTEFMPLFAKYAKEFANNNDALERALEQSQTKQNIFMNHMRVMSKEIMDAGLDKLIGDMFTGMTKFAEVLKPLVIWLTQATLGFIEFIKAIKTFSEEYPIVAGVLLAFIGLFASYKLAVRAGAVGFSAFVTLIIRGVAMIKMALLRSAIFALFVGLAEVLVGLYGHMKGDNNWFSVVIKWLELMKWKLKETWAEWRFFFTGIKAGFMNSGLGKLLSKIYNFDADVAEAELQAEQRRQVPIYIRKPQTPFSSGLSEANFNSLEEKGFKIPVPKMDRVPDLSKHEVTSRVIIETQGKEYEASRQTLNLGGLSA